MSFLGKIGSVILYFQMQYYTLITWARENEKKVIIKIAPLLIIFIIFSTIIRATVQYTCILAYQHTNTKKKINFRIIENHRRIYKFTHTTVYYLFFFFFLKISIRKILSISHCYKWKVISIILQPCQYTYIYISSICKKKNRHSSTHLS